MLIFKSFILIILTINIANIINWINEFISTIPIEEVGNGPHFYIRKDLENGRIY